jgi:hypothetical protein
MQMTSGPSDDTDRFSGPAAGAAQGACRPDEGSRYLDALRELQEREREVLRIVTTIQRAAKDLEHWPAVCVVHAGAGFPKEVTMAGRAIDASTWPTASQLADALAAWHETAEIARTAWARLPRETRTSLPSPP